MTNPADSNSEMSDWLRIAEGEKLAARLREAGQRATPQRMLVLNAFIAPGEHLTADEIYERVARMTPVVNRSTVYRTLELFRDLGLISETDLGSGVRHYELLGTQRHHHLVCQECGGMVELSDDLVEPLRNGIRETYRFDPLIDHLALFGVCERCSDSSESSEDSSLASRD